ncbi:polyamine aminopropyltransferase [Oceanobacter mangrovi]|uniref:spermine/spermidine synthase domain-containing protein n=1 Tax=Oceanobacter mangrovi TaxID=2862510 RepID=UPI001C8E5B4B|nr:polyamine aminopropyltransferase [Oceanobacter mangrovi]
MTYPQADGWFTEVCDPQGSAFSLKVKGRIDSAQSDLHTIDIYDTDSFGKLMVIDGRAMAATRTSFIYYEMMAHTALFAHPNPKRVAILGLGDGGILREVLQHPAIEQAWQVSPDDLVSRLAAQHFPQQGDAMQDPRARLLISDAASWLTSQPDASLDLIILDRQVIAASAVDFYQQCFRVLTSDGILVQASESPLYQANSLIPQLHRELAQSGAGSSHTMPFPQPIYPSGWWSCTLASQESDVTVFRIEDAAEKPFRTGYYNAETHAAGLALPEFMQRALGLED